MTSVAAVPRATQQRPAGRGTPAAVVGGVVGNFVDQTHIFLPVVALAPAMGRLVGPTGAASGTALVVAATLLGRPVGAVVFGRIADRVGRTRTTRVAIAGTAACTLLIACLPSHQVLGAATFVALVALRFLGGVFLAGEYSAAIPLAMEWSRPRQRGLVSGLAMAMSPSAQATIAFVTAMQLALFGTEAYARWGWRASFLAGGWASLAMLGWYRRQVRDAAAPAVAEARRGSLREVLAGPRAGDFWRMFGLMSGLWLMTNMVAVLLASRLAVVRGLDAGQVALVMGLASVGQALVMALAGQLSTVIGRRICFVGWGLAAAVLAPLLWRWVLHGAGPLWQVVAGAVALQAVTVAAYGPVGAYLSEGFDAHVRSTGYGTAYSASLVLPALYPWWLPRLTGALGDWAVPTVLAVGGLLVAGFAAVGPRLSPREIERTRV
ncbi:MFS transporter [Luteococcus peritonei]|uniref:MFS transporter n=1 Tax=Luteococcus peritonei TaxID=88874 RepID=A0ABW4RYC7_9ACTN